MRVNAALGHDVTASVSYGGVHDRARYGYHDGFGRRHRGWSGNSHHGGLHQADAFRYRRRFHRYHCLLCLFSYRHYHAPVDPWWWGSHSYGSHFGAVYHDDHWSIGLSFGTPYAYYSSPTVYVEPVYIDRYVPYPAPPVAVEVVESYDGIARAIDRLKYGEVEERRKAAQELGRRGGLRGLYALIYAVEYDEDALVRFYAARSLGKLGDRDALAPLRRVAKDDPEEVVRVAAGDAVDVLLK